MDFLTKTSFFSFNKTIGDTAQPLIQHHVPFFEVNIHVYDNDVYYGDGTTMSAIAQAGSVLYFNRGSLRDLYFKNRTAGNDGVVVVSATVPIYYVEEALKRGK